MSTQSIKGTNGMTVFVQGTLCCGGDRNRCSLRRFFPSSMRNRVRGVISYGHGYEVPGQ
jgi:hypothetical protein